MVIITVALKFAKPKNYSWVYGYI